MNIVILERDSVGTDIGIDGFNRFGFVTSYANTLKAQAAKRIKDAQYCHIKQNPNERRHFKGCQKYTSYLPFCHRL